MVIADLYRTLEAGQTNTANQHQLITILKYTHYNIARKQCETGADQMHFNMAANRLISSSLMKMHLHFVYHIENSLSRSSTPFAILKYTANIVILASVQTESIQLFVSSRSFQPLSATLWVGQCTLIWMVM
jgi:hypothetical protein